MRTADAEERQLRNEEKQLRTVERLRVREERLRVKVEKQEHIRLLRKRARDRAYHRRKYKEQKEKQLTAAE
jgi:hypothetical protein